VTPSSRQTKFTPNPACEVIRYRYLPRGIQILPDLSLEASFKFSPEFVFFLIGAMKKMFTEVMSLLHSHWAIPLGIIASGMASFKGIPLVVTCHGNDVNIPWRKPMYRGLLRTTLRRADAIISVAKHLTYKLLKMGFDENRIHEIPIGIDVSAFDPDKIKPNGFGVLNPSTKVIGMLGSLLQNKRVDDFVKAAILVTKRNPDVTFSVAGTGPKESTLRRLVSKNGLDNFHFLGRINRGDVPGYLKNLDVFVLSSQSEGLSISLQEAMAMKCAPVVSDSVICPELIKDGKNGLLFKFGNVSDLADKIDDALHESKRMGSAARNIILRDFNLETNSKRLIEVYRTVNGK
jgi:glycosyltransferase involved in cell wall biosynthesis